MDLIYLDDPRELAYWAHVLGISEDELQQIVGMVGPHAIDVRRHLALVRDAERRRERRQSLNDVQHRAQAPRGGSLFAPIVCCAAAFASAFGALAYNPAPSRKAPCEAASNSDPTIRQLRCADGLTSARTNLADSEAARPMR